MTLHLRLAGLALLLTTGCGGRILETDRPAKGHLVALAAKHGQRADRLAKRHQAPSQVVLIERRGLRAIDPVTAREQWSVSADVSGHATSTGSLILVPLHGHRLLAIDRVSGVPVWKVPMPGEALTGMAASGPVVVLSVIDRRYGRSRLVGLSTQDGQLRWTRRSDQRFGAPAAVGGVAVVPLGRQVLGLRLRTGGEVARLDVPTSAQSRPGGAPAFERVDVQGRTLTAGHGTQWVDLSTALASRLADMGEVENGFGDVFADDDGLDPGFGDRERHRMWVDVDETSAGSRSAFLMCRRGVLAFRIDAAGKPVESRWAYLLRDDREFVGMHVTAERVTLVLEDGELLTLGRTDGGELDRIAGGEATVGALFLDVEKGFGTPAKVRPTKTQRLAMLADLVLDPDPRLLPAQLLVTDLLWKDDEPRVREAVAQLATGAVRSETSPAAARLREHALDLVSKPWGRQSPQEAREMLAGLSARPSFLDEVQPPIGMLARAAVAAGDASMTRDLVEHLLHPGTASGDLVELVRALATMDSPEALNGIASFVRRYHADTQAIDESTAVAEGTQALLRRAKRTDDDPGAQLARDTLNELLDDPFTAPSLRLFIDANFPASLRESLEVVAEGDASEPAPVLPDAEPEELGAP